ncbi:MAG: zinc ABC transporter substrate-binding protein [Archaeoglobaceae archaeon]
MRKTYTAFLMLLLFLGIGEGKIFVSIPDLEKIAEKISGEDVESILPSAIDPHFFSLSYSEIKKLETSDMVILANSQLIGFEAEIKKICEEKCLDFEDYNATILEFPGVGHNLHAYWLLPENAVKIGFAIKNKLSELHPERASQFTRNYEEFREAVERAQRNAEKIVSKVKDYDFVAMDPHSAYAISALALKVAFVFPEEIPPGGMEIQKLSGLKNCVIVIADYQEGTKIGEIAEEIAKESGCGFTKVNVMSDLDFDVQLLANAVLLANPSFRDSEKNEILYILSLIAVLEAVALVVIWRSRRKT